MRQVDADGLCRRAFADHNIKRVILQRGVQYLFDLARKPVDLVDKQHVALLQIGQQGGKVAGLFNCRAGRNADLHPHLVRDNAGKGCFAKARRAVEQQVVQRLAPAFRGFKVNAQVAFNLVLPDIFFQCAGAQRKFAVKVLRHGIRRNQPVVCHFHASPHLSGHGFECLFNQFFYRQRGVQPGNGRRCLAGAIPQRAQGRHRLCRGARGGGGSTL